MTVFQYVCIGRLGPAIALHNSLKIFAKVQQKVIIKVYETLLLYKANTNNMVQGGWKVTHPWKLLITLLIILLVDCYMKQVFTVNSKQCGFGAVNLLLFGSPNQGKVSWCEVRVQCLVTGDQRRSLWTALVTVRSNLRSAIQFYLWNGSRYTLFMQITVTFTKVISNCK